MIVSVGEADNALACCLRPNGLTGKTVAPAPGPPLPAPACGEMTWDFFGGLLPAEPGSDPLDADSPALPSDSPPGFIAPDQSSRGEGPKFSAPGLAGSRHDRLIPFSGDAVQWRPLNCKRRLRVSAPTTAQLRQNHCAFCRLSRQLGRPRPSGYDPDRLKKPGKTGYDPPKVNKTFPEVYQIEDVG